MVIRFGSIIEALATIALHLKDFLSLFSGLVKTANPFPSLPVPQVVGTNIIGRAFSLFFMRFFRHDLL